MTSNQLEGNDMINLFKTGDEVTIGATPGTWVVSAVDGDTLSLQRKPPVKVYGFGFQSVDTEEAGIGGVQWNYDREKALATLGQEFLFAGMGADYEYLWFEVEVAADIDATNPEAITEWVDYEVWNGGFKTRRAVQAGDKWSGGERRRQKKEAKASSQLEGTTE